LIGGELPYRRNSVEPKRFQVTVLPILKPGRGYEKFFTPKGLNITAQGKRSAALGWHGNNPNPEGVA
jgi:hypothetical protein